MKESQLELFADIISTNIIEDGIQCNKCGINQPVDNFASITYASGAVEFKRICSSCRKGQSRLIAKLKRENPYPDDDYECPICERTIQEIGNTGQKKLQTWVLDHCHDSKTFRGWVCHHCNTGLGSFKDSVDITEKAAMYLKNHEVKNG